MAYSKAIRAACKQEAFSFRDLETQVPVPHSGTVGFLAELSLSSGYRDGGTLARQGANLPQEGSDFCGSSFLRVNAQLLLRSTLRVSLRVDLPRSLEQAQPGALRKGPSPPSVWPRRLGLCMVAQWRAWEALPQGAWTEAKAFVLSAHLSPGTSLW